MPYHNPFIVNGKIRFPKGMNLVLHVEKWAKVRGDKLAYRFVDFSTERDGEYRDLTWSDFSARNRAVGARLQQVTQPGDRIAILCPQNLDYLIAFFGALYATTEFWNLDGAPATDWTLNWAHGLIENAPHPKHG